MYKVVLSILITIGIILDSCNSKWDESQLPSPVKDAFSKKYPGTTAKWQKEGSQYEAEFNMDGKAFTAVYGADGSLEETEMEISLVELPDSARTYLQSHFKAEEIKEIEKLIMPNGELSFEAEAGGQELLFDSTGRFVKQEKD
jgi:hypothetical protein